MPGVYDPERLSKLSQISTKFHAHAAVGDEIVLGIEGDSEMPAKYRGARPEGIITKIKYQGTEKAVLRIALKDSGRNIDIPPYNVSGEGVWEFKDSTWPKVLARANPGANNNAYRSSGSKDNEIASLRNQLHEITQRYDRESAENKQFNSALVDSIAQITGEVYRGNPDAKFSKVFQEEYRGMSKAQKEASPFDSDMSDDDDF